MAHKLVTDPVAFVHAVANGHKAGFVALLLIPFLGLWLFEPLLLLGAVPDLAINLLSSNPNQTTVQFQYTAGIVPFIVAASILGASRFKRQALDLPLWCLAATAAVAIYSPIYLGAKRRTSARVAAGVREGARGEPHSARSTGRGVEPARRPPVRAALRLHLPVRAARALDRRGPQRLELSRRRRVQASDPQVRGEQEVADRLLLARRDRAAQASDGASVSGPDGRRSPTPPLSIHAWLRYSTIESLLSQIQPRSVLEIGVGQGSVGVLLARRYDYTGIDLDETALATARSRFRRCGVDADTLLLGGLEQVEGREFDLVCAFEVLEHLEDDVAALTEWHAHVAPGGWLALSVPADPRRFGEADEKAGHYRRYTRENLSRVLDGRRIREPSSSELRLSHWVPPGGGSERVRTAPPADCDFVRGAHARQRPLAPTTESAGRVMAIVSWPLGHLQRPFAGRELGTGLVALAERPAQA